MEPGVRGGTLVWSAAPGELRRYGVFRQRPDRNRTELGPTEIAKRNPLKRSGDSRRRQRVGLIAGRSADQRCWVGAPRARESMDKEVAPDPIALIFRCRVFGDDLVPRCRPAPPSTPSNPAPRRLQQPLTRIQEVATAASRRRQRVALSTALRAAPPSCARVK